MLCVSERVIAAARLGKIAKKLHDGGSWILRFSIVAKIIVLIKIAESVAHAALEAPDRNQ